jgi:hypothetical protein
MTVSAFAVVCALFASSSAAAGRQHLPHTTATAAGQPARAYSSHSPDFSIDSSIELHPNVSNLGEHLQRPTEDTEWARWVVLLSTTTADAAACGELCAQYRNGSDDSDPLALCRSFTRYAAPVSGGVVAGWCFGHRDPIWLPLSGVDATTGTMIVDSGLVVRPCASAFDCSHNGVCNASGVCDCSQGWTGRRCETLDLVPVDRAKCVASLPQPRSTFVAVCGHLCHQPWPAMAKHVLPLSHHHRWGSRRVCHRGCAFSVCAISTLLLLSMTVCTHSWCSSTLVAHVVVMHDCITRTLTRLLHCGVHLPPS